MLIYHAARGDLGRAGCRELDGCFVIYFCESIRLASNTMNYIQIRCTRTQSRKANDEPQHYGMQIDAELVGVAERTNPFDAVGQPPSLPSASSDGVVVGRSVVMHVEKI